MIPLLLDLQSRFFAAVYPRTILPYEKLILPVKNRFFQNLSGRVLEIGPGSGSNLRMCHSVEHWTGIEPNRHMHRALRANMRRFEIKGDIIEQGAEIIDLPENTFDTIIGTLVLCSVEQPDRVLEQVLRLLKPGGQYLFIEHVLEPDRRSRQRFQRMIRPFWKFCACGCRPDLDSASWIKQAGFVDCEIEQFHVSAKVLPWFLTPHIAGFAKKPAETKTVGV